MGSTLKDVADLAGVSKVTVHKVIYGKPGVSEKTRGRVMDIVRRVGFAVNPAAASLKRDPLRIAVVALDLPARLNYFHRIVARGIDEAEAELAVYRVSLIRHFCDTTWQSQAAILDRILAGGDIDGVVIYCNDDTRLNSRFEQLREKGVPVVTFHSDAVGSCRLACVTAPDVRSGRLAAEFMSNIVSRGGHILVLGGNKSLKILRDNVAGFFDYMQTHRRDLTLLEVNDFDAIERLMREVEHLIGAIGKVKGIYCNSARNGPPLCEMLSRMGLGGEIKLVTSDVFPELRPYFENGTINATVWQDPKTQVRQAILLMYQYLASRKLPEQPCPVRIGIVLRSNFEDYCDGPAE